MSPSDPSSDSFSTRMARAFVNLLKLLLFIAIIVAIGAGAWLGYRELVRSFNVIADRADLNAERIELMRRDVDTLVTDTSQEDSIATLEAAVATQETQISDLHAQLDEDLARQESTLRDLQLQVTALISHTDVLTRDVAVLEEGISSLQGDLNTNRSDLDELGGDLDALGLALEALDEQFQEVSEDAGALASMQEALTLFRVWELVSRARLRLLEGNAGLAAADLDAASGSVERLGATLEADAESDLLDLQARLALAHEGLPEDPAAAARDLETAWETLDTLLMDRLGDVAALQPALTVTPTLTITATLTSTPGPTATPPVTPTNTPAP